jgi:hypothetical protein
MVFRDRRPSRHRAVPDSPVDATPDTDLESYLAAVPPGSDSTSTEVTGRFGVAQVFQVRLPGRQTEQLRRLADARGVPPISLVIDWVLERLEREGQGPSTPRAPVTPRGPGADRGRADRRTTTIGPLGSPSAGPGLIDPVPGGRAPADDGRFDRGSSAGPAPAPPRAPQAPPAPPARSGSGDTALEPLGLTLDGPPPSAGRAPDRTPDPALASLGTAEAGPVLDGRLAPLALFGEHDLSPAGPPGSGRPHGPDPDLPHLGPGGGSALTDPGPPTAELPPLPRDGDAIVAQFSAAPTALAAAEPEPAVSTPPSVTPIFRAGTELPDPDERSGPRHRAPEPVTSLLTRRRF